MITRLSLTLLAALSLCLPASGATPSFSRILFVGNSITLHGPSTKIGWEGNWGMAATAKEKDYSHLVVAGVTQLQGKAPEFLITNVADFERNFTTFDFDTKLQAQLDFKPDTVIVAIGENVPALKTEEDKTQFKDAATRLFKILRGTTQANLYVRSSFWANAVKDTILKEACEAAGGTFVDISTLAGDESNYARSERQIAHEGVARHPGDKGMQAIATALLQSLKKTATP